MKVKGRNRSAGTMRSERQLSAVFISKAVIPLSATSRHSPAAGRRRVRETLNTRPADVAQQLARVQPCDRSLYGLYGVAHVSVSILYVDPM